MPNYISKHQARSNRRGGGVSIYIHNSLKFKERPDLTINKKAIYLPQKHAVRIVFNENNMTHSRPLLRSLNALNIYQINLFQHLHFMYNFNKNETPIIFYNLIKKPIHKYPTKFSKNSFSLKTFFLNGSKYCISFRGPKIWNDFLTNEEKEINSYLLFSKAIKSKLIETEEERRYF